MCLAATIGCVAGCTDEEPEEPAGHTHPGGASVSLPVGDGTTSDEVGYQLASVRLPERADAAGELTFQVLYTGRAQTKFLVEQTKKMHVYVVRDDLAVFRHVHPTMAEDGSWQARLTLPSGGRYRVVAEFVAEDDGGNGDHLILGDTVVVAGNRTPAPKQPGERADDGIVQVAVDGDGTVSDQGRLAVTVGRAGGGGVRLGTYLGTYAHLTGFAESGAMVHMHPLGAPEPIAGQHSADGSRLEFHSTFAKAGSYRLFVQVRVDGLVHTVPVTATVR